jgi:hypothetical protein
VIAAFDEHYHRCGLVERRYQRVVAASLDATGDFDAPDFDAAIGSNS